jgi:hypothetical protein
LFFHAITQVAHSNGIWEEKKPGESRLHKRQRLARIIA